MSISYQALLGETAINADSIVVQDIVAEKGIIANLDVTKRLYVEGETEMNDVIINHKLSIPTGAADGSILTSDAQGIATWKPNVHDGDITGTASATVQHHKWIGNWSFILHYYRFNRVTHKHIEYRALSNNFGVEPVPGALQKGYSMYNDNYPPPPVLTLMYPNSEWHSRIGFNLRPQNHGKLTHFRFFKVPESTRTSITLHVITMEAERRHKQVYPVSEGSGWKEIHYTSSPRFAAAFCCAFCLSAKRTLPGAFCQRFAEPCAFCQDFAMPSKSFGAFCPGSPFCQSFAGPCILPSAFC